MPAFAGMNNPTTGPAHQTSCCSRRQSIRNAQAGAGQAFGKFGSSGPLRRGLRPLRHERRAGQLLKNMRPERFPWADSMKRREIARRGLDRIKIDLAEGGKGRGTGHRQGRANRPSAPSSVASARPSTSPKEDPLQRLSRYDTRARWCGRRNINKKWNNYKFYVDKRQDDRQSCCCCRGGGCASAAPGFVTVTTNFVWDNQCRQQQLRREGRHGLSRHARLDHAALSAFIEDVEGAWPVRQDSCWCAAGEIGRTPKINKAGGRDHWGNLGPLLLYGGRTPHRPGHRPVRPQRRQPRHGAGPHPEPAGHRAQTRSFDINEAARSCRALPREIGAGP